MRQTDFVLMLKDILNEYRILQDSPLNAIKNVMVAKLDGPPQLMVFFEGGEVFDIFVELSDREPITEKTIIEQMLLP